MIWFTGDTHREIDIRKLNTRSWPEQCDLTKDDFLIVLGDFGCVWDGGRADLYWQKWRDKKPYTTLFVPGNHENYDLLRQYPEEEWNGGVVRRIQPSVLMLERGHVFEIDGKRIFAMGGAESHDAEYRKLGVSMWKQELPSPEEYVQAFRAIAQHDNEVDLIISHCAPGHIEDQILCRRVPIRNELTAFLEGVSRVVNYDLWLFGHYHMNAMVTEKHICLYDCVAPLDRIIARRNELIGYERMHSQDEQCSE